MIGCSSSSTEQNVFCRNCKTSVTGGVGEEILCNSCTESQRSPASFVEKRDLGWHKLVFNNDVPTDGIALASCACGQGLGILCFCCKTEVSPSQFEAHAGFASRCQPYPHTYLKFLDKLRLCFTALPSY